MYFILINSSKPALYQLATGIRTRVRYEFLSNVDKYNYTYDKVGICTYKEVYDAEKVIALSQGSCFYNTDRPQKWVLNRFINSDKVHLVLTDKEPVWDYKQDPHVQEIKDVILSSTIDVYKANITQKILQHASKDIERQRR